MQESGSASYVWILLGEGGGVVGGITIVGRVKPDILIASSSRLGEIPTHDFFIENKIFMYTRRIRMYIHTDIQYIALSLESELDDTDQDGL